MMAEVEEVGRNTILLKIIIIGVFLIQVISMNSSITAYEHAQRISEPEIILRTKYSELE